MSKVDGTLLSIRDGKREFEYSRYTRIGETTYPQHIDYREGKEFSLSADVRMSKLDSLPEGTFDFPRGSMRRCAATRLLHQLPIQMTQPEVKGRGDDPVITVGVHLFVTQTGGVMNPKVVKPVRPDLDEAAIKQVQGGRSIRVPATASRTRAAGCGGTFSGLVRDQLSGIIWGCRQRASAWS